MPTERKRFSISLDDETLEIVENYQADLVVKGIELTTAIILLRAAKKK